MVWSDQSQFPFSVYDNNGNLVAIINENGMTIYGNGQLNVLNPGNTGQGVALQISQTTGAAFIVLSGRTSTGGKQYYMTFDDQNNNAFEEFAGAGSKWHIFAVENSWKIWDTTNFNGAGLDGTDGVFKAVRSTNFETWHAITVFNAGWGNLLNYGPVEYWLTPSGKVELSGAMAAGTITDGTTIFTFPSNYVPSKRRLLTPAIGPSGSGTAAHRLFIQSTTDALPGAVQCYGFGTGVTDVSLDGLSFKL